MRAWAVGAFVWGVACQSDDVPAMGGDIGGIDVPDSESDAVPGTTGTTYGGGEGLDDGSTSTTTTSTSGTTTCEGSSCDPEPRCGDGALDDGEMCDDGNRMAGDGCSGICVVEANYICRTPGEACVSTIVCGDGEIAGGEGCDDGNDVSGDGCSSRCLVEGGYACPAPNMPCVSTSTAECGNGTVEYPETCDDGNTDEDDGCSEVCAREPGYSCPVPGSLCVPDEFCGDGVLSDQEECDDLNLTPGDGCDGRCRTENFYICPVPGEPCESLIVCGDLQVIADEACDDGRQCTDGTDCSQDPSVCSGIGDESCEPRGGDGCSADCRTTEPGYRCPTSGNVGGACTEIPDPACGDGRRDFGEFCDDGNLDPDDGCTADCTVSAGYTCPSEGRLCERIAWCGDGTRGTGEQCDDGSLCADETTSCADDASVCVGIGDGTCAARGGDGCSATCAIEAEYTCPSEGGACTSLVHCGDGRLGGQETCDRGGRCEDGTTPCTDDPSVCAGIGSGTCVHADAPGCESCDLEDGWACSRGGNCRAAACGDGIVAGLEFCDDGRHCSDGSACADDGDCSSGACEARSGDGCDERCNMEPNYACETQGEPCRPTTCGDGIHEGSEQCDDGNNDLGDGCTPFCEAEPLCAFGPCTSQCGDAIVFASEACDDGNVRDGDGCSSSCEIEDGFACEVSDTLPDEIRIPIVMRDYHGSDSSNPPDEHPDFELATGEPTGLTLGIVRTGVSACFEDLGQAGDADDRIRGGDLGCVDETYEMLNNAGSVIATISLWGKPVFFDVDCHRSQDPSAGNGWSQCIRTVADADSFHQWFTDRPDGVSAPAWNANPTQVEPLTLVNGRFSSGGAFTAGGSAYSFDSRSMSLADPDPSGTQDGFYPLDALAITGTSCGSASPDHNFHFTSEVRYWFEYDADVQPTLTFSGDDDVWVYVNGFLALDIGGIHGRTERSLTLNAVAADAWGLRDGNIYEIAVFQAERNQCASNYWLTLDGFVPRTSMCESDCGDGSVASTEDCDDGAEHNNGSYEGCNADCTLGPYCGDEVVQEAAGEVCDAGTQFVVYGGTEPRCGPQCQYAPYCGDGNLDGGFGEACDDGVNDGTYGTCNPNCTLAPYCGDGTPSGVEECDEGVNNGTTSSACRVDCTLKCGDGTLDAGEECDAGEANADTYGACRTDCRLGPYCGDGITQAQHEACDDGLNDGSHGTCAPGCVLGPRCGDGVVQASAGERCDQGAGNVAPTYGVENGCTTRCMPTPYCGDGAVTDAETCDDGVNSGAPGSCTPTCDGFVPLTSCGNGRVDGGEQCDHGVSNGEPGDVCDANCRLACGNGILDEGETCDDGVNDGAYGGCEDDCTPAGYCGDGVRNGPEGCDAGSGNQENPYGAGLCSLSCAPAPYCGDGRTDVRFGEQCDGQVNCTRACVLAIG